MEFIWDKKKEILNIKKHGLNFTDAALVFSDPFAIYLNDIFHSIFEHREIVIGEIQDSKTIVVSYIEKIPDEDLIRIISARPAEKNEIKEYNKRIGHEK
jgi:uncharacterized DUF497 family protein